MKRLYEFYTTSAELLKETTDEASIVKRSLGGASCISCDKDVNNVYGILNQSQDPINWAKISNKDSKPLSPKVFMDKINRRVD